MSCKMKKDIGNKNYIPIVLWDFYSLKSTLWLQILSCENDDVLFCTPKYIHNFYECGPVHLYHDIYKVCWYSMNYIMLLQYELQYDATSSVADYNSITTIIWGLIKIDPHPLGYILISFLNKINYLRFQTSDNTNKSIFLKLPSEYFSFVN